MELWLVIVLVAVVAGIVVALTVLRAPRRVLVEAARGFEEYKQEVGAVLGADLERMRAALESAPEAPAAQAAVGRARERYGVAAEHAARAAAADGTTFSSEVTACTMALMTAARELVAAEASAAGEPEPEPTPPCLLDPAHGPSSTTLTWTPPGGLPRPVPVCAADAARIAAGERPEVRMVVTEGDLVPYFDAHARFVDWLLGYFSGFDPYLTARLLAGTTIGAHLPGHIRARHGASADQLGEFGRPDS